VANVSKLGLANDVDPKIGTVGGDSGKALLRFDFALRQVSQELRLCISSFSRQITFNFENGSTEKGVNPASHFRDLPLKIDAGPISLKSFGKKFIDERAHLLVAWLGGQLDRYSLEFVLFQ
jgi:hypothetical protein